MHPGWAALASILCITAIAPTHPQTPAKRAIPKNVRSGLIAACDPAAATLLVKSSSGIETPYRFTDSTRVLLGKRPAQAVDLKIGQAITVRFRESKAGPSALLDVADRDSWVWLDRIRHELTAVTVKEVTEEGLSVTEGQDLNPVFYRITRTTKIEIGGRECDASALDAGQKVTVAPRLLANGAIRAVSISDSAKTAAVLKERAQPTVTGTVKAFDATKRRLTIVSRAGDEVAATLTDNTKVRSESRDVKQNAIRVGQVVTLHLKRQEDGERTLMQVTIKRRSAPSAGPQGRGSP